MIEPQKEVEMFKAEKDTNRFRANQKVWIRIRCANCLIIWFKWRGSGRYVQGVISIGDKSIGEIKTIMVSAPFAERIFGDEGAKQ